MSNGERSGSGESKVRLATGIGTVVGAAVALFVVKPLVQPLVELPFWLGLIAFVVVTGIGGVLGKLVGRLRKTRGGQLHLARCAGAIGASVGVADVLLGPGLLEPTPSGRAVPLGPATVPHRTDSLAAQRRWLHHLPANTMTNRELANA
jgi:hypothetical protein